MVADLRNPLATDMKSDAPGSVVLVLALMMVLAPALGVRNEEMLQDTLKSIVVSFSALAGVFVCFWHLREQSATLYFHKLLYLPLALMAYALGSMAWSHTYLGGVEAVRWFVFGLILWLGLNALTRERLTYLLWGIHLGAVLASLWTALQFWFDWSFFAQGPNPASTFVNRNFFGEFIVCTFPFSTLLLYRVRDKVSVFALVFSLAFNVVALLMTGTRSALIGLLMLLVLVPVIVARTRAQMASTGWRQSHWVGVCALFVASVIALGSIGTANPALIAESGRGNALHRATERLFSMTKSSEYSAGSFSIRSRLWKASARMIAAHPLTGVGAGAWEVQAPRFQEAGSQLETDYYAHNEPLQLIAEYGLVGWLFLLSLLGYLAAAARRTLTDDSPTGALEAPLRALTLSSLLVFLLVSNAGFAWRMAGTGALFAISLAILAASDTRLAPGRAWLWHRWTCGPRCAVPALSLTAICFGLGLYLAQQAVECESKIVQAVRIALAISRSGEPRAAHWDDEKKRMFVLLREGIAINPHYRKLTPMVADNVASWGDWKDATWIWESILRSRPYVVVILANVARGHIQAGEYDDVQQLIDRARDVQPNAPAVASLEVVLWSRTGRQEQATQRAKALLASGFIDNDLFQTSYSLAIAQRDQSLAVAALDAAIKQWPERAVDGWIRLGRAYDSIEPRDQGKALSAYRNALAIASPRSKKAVLAAIPTAYRERVQ